MRILTVALALVAGCKKDDPEPTGMPPVELCHADEVPDEATRRFGWQDDGTFVSFGGKVIDPAGPTLDLENLPLDVAVHPDGTFAYVVLVDRGSTRLSVVDLDRMAEIASYARDNLLTGMEIDPVSLRLYVAAGAAEAVDAFDIQPDGTLGTPTRIAVPGSTTAGLALSPDGTRLWVASYDSRTLTEIDTTTDTVVRDLAITTNGWDVVHVPGRDEVYVSELTGEGISVVDLGSWTEVGTIDLPASPAGMAASDDGSRVYVAVSNGDRVAAIETSSRSVVLEADVTEQDLLDEDGLPLGNSNVNALWLDGDRLFVTRGTDNAVSVVDADTLEVAGAFPVPQYPVDVERASTGELVVVAYKGSGEQSGALTSVDFDGLDLAATTADVSALYRSPIDRFPFECDGFFPIPSQEGQQSPIEHVVLVVKENKTVDCLFGDMEVPGLTTDASLQRYPAEYTPNQRALLTGFATSDNFYVDARESDSGHLFLTSLHLTHYVEFMWVETARNDSPPTWPVAEPAFPSVGNFFSHLVDNGHTIRIYGEVVGLNGQTAAGDYIADYADFNYPGGPAVNYSVLDEDKAAYLGEQIDAIGLADFTYVSFPNDHGQGTSPGIPTPESMVADNDRAVGLLVDAISHSDLWESTVVFVLQDDPQGCGDSVNDSRSPLMVVSPWAKRGYVSRINTNFLSVFATIERILGVPPLARPDAVAVPLWDMFQPEADLSPFDAIDRVPQEANPSNSFAGGLSGRLDFSGPDRSVEWYAVQDAYLQWKMGRISLEEAERRLEQPRMALDEELWEELDEEVEEEVFAYDAALDFVKEYAAERGKTLVLQENPGRTP